MEFECRTCLKVSANVRNIFSYNLPHKIETISSVVIPEDDRFTSKICEECLRNVTLLYDFRQVIQTSNEVLMKRSIKEEDVTVTETYLNEEIFEIKDKETDFKFKQEVIFVNDEFKASGLKSKKIKDEETNFELKEEVFFDVDDDEEIGTPGLKSENNELFYCILCDFSTFEYNLWCCHQTKHNKPRHTCSVCRRSGLKYNLRNHNQPYLGSLIMCLICKKVYKHEKTLRSHMETHENWSYPCKMCGKVYRSKQGYNSHLKQHAIENTKRVECATCGKLFLNKKLLVNHMYSHTGERPFPCKYCDRGFTSNDARNTHESVDCVHYYHLESY